MKNCELLSSMSVNSGVASNLSRDLISAALLNNEKLNHEHFSKISEIKARLRTALIACEQLERRANDFKTEIANHD